MTTSHQVRIPRMGQPTAYQDAAFVDYNDLILGGNPRDTVRYDPTLLLHDNPPRLG